jgi:hypothetical protein
MSDLTLTPDLRYYLLAAAVVLGVGGSTVATRLRQRWLVFHGVSFAVVYGVTLALAVACGAMAFGGAPLLLSPVTRWPVDVALGIIVGWAGFAADRAINRRWRRRELGRRPSRPVGSRSEQRVWRAMAAPADVSTGEPSSMRDVLAIAVLEEAVFRGVLLRFALSTEATPLVAALLVAIIGVFALEHVHFGWSHVAGKLPYSAAVTVGAVGLGSSVMAIAAHVVLNLLIFRHLREVHRLATRCIAPVRAPF